MYYFDPEQKSQDEILVINIIKANQYNNNAKYSLKKLNKSMIKS